ncbi:MAG TPA: CRTAC1 family protein [Thermoanaerobaculia bacterium]|nr:CRTAC1 family protein [Thermoanaerobaculia bacterium]
MRAAGQLSAGHSIAPSIAAIVLALAIAGVVAIGGAAPANAEEARSPGADVPFRDLVREAGITFQRRSAPEKKYILESMSGGVALLDFNNDGLLDIYFPNSLTVATAGDPESAPSALYENLGGMEFVDVAREAGVAYPGWGMGACVADVDGDGWQDLYVTTVGRDRLYRNRGDGTFEDATEASGIVTDGWSTGCGFADYDRDGDLDLFVSRYVKVALDDLPEFGKGKFCLYRGVEVQCGPRGLPGSGDYLFRNDGAGRFEEVGEEAGVSDPDEYFGLGIAWIDDDRDGWPDLFVANDAGPNHFYRNQKDGTFQEEGFPLGVAVSENGAEQGCMGVAIGDYLNEGRLSLFVTNFSEEYNVFYRHQGDHFVDASFRSATAPPSLPYVGWGTAFLDYDNDGWLDLVVANGHVYPQMAAAKLGASAGYEQRKLFYRNRRDGTFEEIGETLGPAFTELRVSRGLALGDLDNDGRLDLVITDLDGPPQILHNEVAAPGNWLLVKLQGKGKLTDAIGAIITMRAGEQTMSRMVNSGTSYLSQGDMRQHFGLGAAARADSIEVRWPDGTTSQRENVEANRILVIEQE